MKPRIDETPLTKDDQSSRYFQTDRSWSLRSFHFGALSARSTNILLFRPVILMLPEVADIIYDILYIIYMTIISGPKWMNDVF